MLDFHGQRHRPAATPVRATDAPASTFTVRKTAWGEDWTRGPEAKRSSKAGRAKGAKTLEEHRVLTALRAAPATSIGDLANRSNLNETAAMLTFSTLLSRNLVREVNSAFGTTTMVAID